MSRLGIIAVLPLRGISYLNTTHPSTIIYNLSTTKRLMQGTGYMIQDAGCKYRVSGSVLGPRYPALGANPVPGIRCQVPGSRYPTPGTGYLDERPGPRQNSRCLSRKTSTGVCRIGGVYVACSIGDPSLSPADFETVSPHRFAMGPRGTPK